jgi:hypothetical protein
LLSFPWFVDRRRCAFIDRKRVAFGVMCVNDA